MISIPSRYSLRIGIVVGPVSGYRGGLLDEVLMRVSGFDRFYRHGWEAVDCDLRTHRPDLFAAVPSDVHLRLGVFVRRHNA